MLILKQKRTEKRFLDSKILYTMEANLNQKLIGIVLEYIPKNVKPVSFLMEYLQLSRESAYRRLRGEIPFSVEEISLLSVTLGFSLDEIIGDIKKYRAFFDFVPETEDSFQMFFSMLEKCYENTEKMLRGNSFESIIALNRLPPVFLVFFDHTFKFIYYEWMHQNSLVSTRHAFSETFIPPELTLLKDNIQNNLTNIPNNILILDPNIFLSLVKDIQYFYQRKLIDAEELELLRNEVFVQIDFFEKIAKTGRLESKAKVHLYLSPLYIGTNIGCFSFDHTIESIFWAHTINSINIYNPELCSMHKRWLDSLKRQSTLITQSNEMLQTDFFDRQREYVKQNLTINFD
jgi:hypothetical protein